MKIRETNIMDYKITEVKDERFKTLQSKMIEYIEQKKLPSLITLLYQNGALINCEKYGMADVENKIPIEFENIFRIASMTKPIVSAAALMLYEEGHFSMDDPLSKYIPKAKDLKVFTGENNGNINTEKLNREVTILDLFTHTGGFSYLSDLNHPLDKKFFTLMQEVSEKPLAEVINPLFDIPLKYQPGFKFHYSLSTDILGYVIENISKTSIDKFLQERIFSKLGMKDTGFYVPDTKRDRLVHLYARNEEGQLITVPGSQQRLTKNKTRFFSGGGGLVSTLSDFLKFALLLLNNGRFEEIQLLKEETVQLMTRDHVLSRGIPFISKDSVKNLKLPEHMEKSLLDYSNGSGFGLGVQVKLEESKTPSGIHGWSGAFLTDYWVDPKNNLVCILLSQFTQLFLYPILIELRNLVYEGLKS